MRVILFTGHFSTFPSKTGAASGLIYKEGPSKDSGMLLSPTGGTLYLVTGERERQLRLGDTFPGVLS
jgi:hypothetical protein